MFIEHEVFRIKYIYQTQKFLGIFSSNRFNSHTFAIWYFRRRKWIPILMDEKLGLHYLNFSAFQHCNNIFYNKYYFTTMLKP